MLYTFVKAGVLALLSARAAVAVDTLQTTYDSTNLFSTWNFINSDDPTHGYVGYQDYQSAQSLGLIETPGEADGSTVARIKVDSTSVPAAGARGRKSVRIESQVQFNYGLFIADVLHMPSSTCGLWPALWAFGPNWDQNGEIDIIEGFHEATTNLVSLHVTSSEGACTLVPSQQSGAVESAQCDDATTGDTGCGVSGGSYGTPSNEDGGGVYAMEWTSGSIKVWNFPRQNIPVNIASGSPDPSTWGASILNAGVLEAGATSCDIDSHFRNMNLVIDTTFCGDWAGNVWQQTSCYQADPAEGNTCVNYVQNNPQAYVDAYWDIKSIKVYQQAAANSGERYQPAPKMSSSPPEGTGDVTQSLKESSARIPQPSGVISLPGKPHTTDVPSADISRRPKSSRCSLNIPEDETIPSKPIILHEQVENDVDRPEGTVSTTNNVGSPDEAGSLDTIERPVGLKI